VDLGHPSPSPTAAGGTARGDDGVAGAFMKTPRGLHAPADNLRSHRRN
jgi:hypothetical protein